MRIATYFLRTLSALALAACGISPSFAQTYTIGTGTATNDDESYPTPFGDYYVSTRQQFLFRASELTGAGAPAGGGTITALSWNVTALNGSGAHAPYSIRVSTTSVSALGATTWQPAGTTVFSSSSYTPSLGANTFTFSAPISWNGTDNILVDICHGTGDGFSYTSNASVAYSTTTFNSSRTYASDFASTPCTYSGVSSGEQNATFRPNTAFTIIPSTACQPPSGLALSSATANGATLRWTDGGQSAPIYRVEYGPAGFTQGTGTVVAATDTFLTIAGLPTGTAYQFYVRSVCSATDSSILAGPAAFSTPLTCGATYTDPGGVAADYPNSASVVTTICPTNAGDVVTVTFSSFDTEEEWDGIYVYNGNSTSAVQIASPNPAGDASGPLGNKAGAFWGNTIPGPFTSTNANGCLTFEFLSDASFTYDGFAASVTCAPPATCPAPGSLFANNETSSSAELGWTENGNATQWRIEYGPSGFTPGTGNFVLATTNPYTLGGLTANTNYEFYVRSLCSPTDSSTQIGPEFFSTLPTPPVNDNATGAIALTTGSGCPATLFTNTNATQSTGEPVATCGGTTGSATVWFSFTAPMSGAVRVSTDYAGGDVDDSRIGLFSATNPADYTTFQLLACDEDNGSVEANNSVLYATGLTGGAVYYVQVGNFSNFSTTGTFCVTVDELSGAMLTTTALSCEGGQTPYGSNAAYTGWVTLVDDNSRLVALVRNTAGGAVNGYANSLTINTGAVRLDGFTNKHYLNRNYLINNSAVSNAQVQFFFTDAELAALQAVDPTANLSNLRVVRQTGITCQTDFNAFAGSNTSLLQTGSGSASGASWVTVTTPGFSNFFIEAGSGTSLNLSGVALEAAAEGSRNRIVWQAVGSEPQGLKYALMRSADGREFKAIETRVASGTGTQYIHYDATPLAGANYYRVIASDVSGRIVSSSTVRVFVANAHSFALSAFPNPVKDALTVSVDGEMTGAAHIMLTDVSGRVLQSIPASGSTATMDMHNLPAGLYLVRYTDGARTETVKVTKQ